MILLFEIYGRPTSARGPVEDPPVLLLALMGLQINQLIFAIILTTGASLVVAITAAKLYARLPGSRASNPQRGGA